MLRSERAVAVLSLLCMSFIGISCSHALRVKNLEMYATPFQIGGEVEKPVVAILPFKGSPDELWYFNAIVERLAMDPQLGRLQTDYLPHLASEGRVAPDVILEVRPSVRYRSSGWNFLVNWPGFLIFTPAWNGYIYHADVMTQVVIRDGRGEAVDQIEVPVSYDVRHADMDRTIWTGLTWLEVSALALIGGVYNANVFDRDVIAPMQVQVKDNYANFVLSQTQKRIQSVAGSLRRRDLVGTSDEASPDVAAPAPADPSEH